MTFFYLDLFEVWVGGLSVVLCRIPLKYFLDSSQFDLFLMFRGSLFVGLFSAAFWVVVDI